MRVIHLVDAGAEIARRRAALPPGTLVEVWPDLIEPRSAWVEDETKRLLESVGSRISPKLSVDGDLVGIYYGPRLRDVESLPREDSLRARVLSAHGVAVAWVTLDERGERVTHDAETPEDPIFYLRRPRGSAAHLWQLFRTKAGARAFTEQHFPDDPEARQWAMDLRVDDFPSLIGRSTGERAPGGPY